MPTPEPLAVGKSFAAVIPETWTKSTPEFEHISMNRNGPGSPRAAGSVSSIAGCEREMTESGLSGTAFPGFWRPSQPAKVEPNTIAAGSHQNIPGVADR